jgi:hypothetical protein
VKLMVVLSSIMQGERLLHRHWVLPYKVNHSRHYLKESPFDVFLSL